MKNPDPLLSLLQPNTKAEMGPVRELFVEYWNWLQFDPCFQGFEKELADLPGDYQSPKGCILLAQFDGALAGCVALRGIGDGRGEMKRLYVRPTFRGKGIGVALTTAIIDQARQRNYTHIRLDTLPLMAKAVALYESLGFVDIKPYTKEPIEGARYLELDLSK